MFSWPALTSFLFSKQSPSWIENSPRWRCSRTYSSHRSAQTSPQVCGEAFTKVQTSMRSLRAHVVDSAAALTAEWHESALRARTALVLVQLAELKACEHEVAREERLQTGRFQGLRDVDTFLLDRIGRVNATWGSLWPLPNGVLGVGDASRHHDRTRQGDVMSDSSTRHSRGAVAYGGYAAWDRGCRKTLHRHRRYSVRLGSDRWRQRGGKLAPAVMSDFDDASDVAIWNETSGALMPNFDERPATGTSRPVSAFPRWKVSRRG